MGLNFLKPEMACTLSRIIMQWKMAVFERYLLLEGPIFHFHDDGRKGILKKRPLSC